MAGPLRTPKHRRRDTERPHVPFYKDERIIGKRLTVSVSLRLLIAALLLFVVTLGWGLFTVIDSNDRVTKYVRDAHNSRVQDQQRTDAKIAALACAIVEFLPDGISPTVKNIRSQYHCPPVKPKPKPTTPASPAAHITHPASSSGASGQADGPATGSTLQASGTPGTQRGSSAGSGTGPIGGGTRGGGSPGGATGGSAGGPPPSQGPPAPTPSPVKSGAVNIPGLTLPTLVSGPVLGIGGSSCTLSLLGTCTIG